MSGSGSGVRDFYANRCVLLTGATGFMGKVSCCFLSSPPQIMLEKLVRACPEVDKIYLIVRKKGQLSPQERVTSLLESEVHIWYEF